MLNYKEKSMSKLWTTQNNKHTDRFCYQILQIHTMSQIYETLFSTTVANLVTNTYTTKLPTYFAPSTQKKRNSTHGKYMAWTKKPSQWVERGKLSTYFTIIGSPWLGLQTKSELWHLCWSGTTSTGQRILVQDSWPAVPIHNRINAAITRLMGNLLQFCTLS